MMKFDPAVWGTVSDWTTAIATIAALIAAGVAAWFAYKAFRLQEKQDQERIDANRRHQAERVVAWLNFDTANSDVEMWFFNGSQLPVWDLEIMFLGVSRRRDQPIPLHIHKFGFQPPTDKPVMLAVVDHPLADDQSRVPRVRFRDAADANWVRDKDGRLNLVDGELPF